MRACDSRTHEDAVYGAERGTKKGPASSDARLGGPLTDLLSPEIPSPRWSRVLHVTVIACNPVTIFFPGPGLNEKYFTGFAYRPTDRSLLSIVVKGDASTAHPPNRPGRLKRTPIKKGRKKGRKEGRKEGKGQSGACETSEHRREELNEKQERERGERRSLGEEGRRKPRAPGRQNDQKANFIHYFHFNATVSQFMGGPGFMRARIRTTGPNLRRERGHRTETLPGRVWNESRTRRAGARALSGPIVKNFVLKHSTSRIVYVNNL